MGIFFSILVTFVFICNVDARPISYSGGHTLMHFNDSMKESIYYHYSPTYKFSIGLETMQNKVFSINETNIRFTYLLNRKNKKLSQRNLYFQSAISTKDNNYVYGMHGDWETRRYFIGFDYKEVKNIIDYTDKHIQLGLAPYLGEYGDLHTWLMLKTKKNSINNKQITYPVVKFFKDNVLLELGYDKKTDWDIQLIYRF
tara:strand:+ start:216 stop:812 length:597 start_codon:yes stop_codon:yes gene_type:complete